jgi:hypothetical protein
MDQGMDAPGNFCDGNIGPVAVGKARHEDGKEKTVGLESRQEASFEDCGLAGTWLTPQDYEPIFLARAKQLSY